VHSGQSVQWLWRQETPVPGSDTRLAIKRRRHLGCWSLTLSYPLQIPVGPCWTWRVASSAQRCWPSLRGGVQRVWMTPGHEAFFVGVRAASSLRRQAHRRLGKIDAADHSTGRKRQCLVQHNPVMALYGRGCVRRLSRLPAAEARRWCGEWGQW